MEPQYLESACLKKNDEHGLSTIKTCHDNNIMYP